VLFISQRVTLPHYIQASYEASGPFRNIVQSVFLKILNLFLFKINIFKLFLNFFNALMLKIIFKNKNIYYFNTFLSKKHFKK